LKMISYNWIAIYRYKLKNKFRWQWLETTVEITLKGERKSITFIE